MPFIMNSSTKLVALMSALLGMTVSNAAHAQQVWDFAGKTIMISVAFDWCISSPRDRQGSCNIGGWRTMQRQVNVYVTSRRLFLEIDPGEGVIIEKGQSSGTNNDRHAASPLSAATLSSPGPPFDFTISFGDPLRFSERYVISLNPKGCTVSLFEPNMQHPDRQYAIANPSAVSCRVEAGHRGFGG